MSHGGDRAADDIMPPVAGLPREVSRPARHRRPLSPLLVRARSLKVSSIVAPNRKSRKRNRRRRRRRPHHRIVRPAAAAPTRPIEQVEQHRAAPASRARATTASSVNGATFRLLLSHVDEAERAA
jgi:hypothetical protein